jgi:hypothetical protein
MNQRGGTGVVGLTAEQSDRSVGIEFANFFAPELLQIRSGKFPGFNPTPADDDLLRSPGRQGRGLVFHTRRIA